MASYYVDPAINANTGAGTLGDPYGDLQYALNTVTRDASIGDRINIKVGTAEVLTAALSLATYGTPSLGVPLTLAGYTSAEDDGGQAEISGAATYSICTATPDGLSYRDLKMGNCGSANILSLGRFGGLYNCDVHTSTGAGITGNADGAPIVSSIIRGISGIGVASSAVHNCLFMNEGGRAFSTAAATTIVTDSILYLSGASHGMGESAVTSPHLYLRNSLLSVSASGSATGIEVRAIRSGVIAGNIVEGFITGMTLQNTSEHGWGALHNACFNNTTNYSSNFGRKVLVNSSNETLGSTAFAKSGSVTWADRQTYFALNSVGSVRTGLFGFASKGAVPYTSGSGGVRMAAGMSGGMR